MTNTKFQKIDEFLGNTFEEGISDIYQGVSTFIGENYEDAEGYFDEACDLIRDWADRTEIEQDDKGNKTFWGMRGTEEEICVKYLRFCPFGYGRMS